MKIRISKLQIFAILVLLAIIGSTIAALSFTRYLRSDPLLWLSMPESSRFSDETNQETISISLTPIEGNYKQVTDFQFFPGSDTELLVLEKNGEISQLNLGLDSEEASSKQILKLDVFNKGEQGLLGIAIHPDFPELPCIYLNATIIHPDESKEIKMSQVSEWCFENKLVGDINEQLWYQNKVIFELDQPFKNHNAGHLIFDSNNLLYIPWGDGGSAKDPLEHGQNLQTYLGSILRVNPEAGNPDIAYTIPKDNPFVGQDDVADEVYAYGFRNPWKLSFDTQGRLITGDVGQYKWEEITFVEAGGNHGWNELEGLHCFKENCSAEGTVLPFIEYDHEAGRSVTAGYQYLSDDIPELKNKYVFGDFVSGRIWAANLPKTPFKAELNTEEIAKSYTKVYQLGQWPLIISSFARDNSGRMYVADFARAKLFRISPSENSK